MLGSTAVGLVLFQLLRILPLTFALLRKMGPAMTKKERSKTWMALRPLNDPGRFLHALIFSNTILFFMVIFVYSTLAPISTYVLAFCFVAMNVGYRHQFFYIFPPTPDSGGRLWLAFVNIALACMIIAELALVGYLGMKKAPVAAPLMIPLLIFTVLFVIYLRQRHFKVTRCLPLEDCRQLDLINNKDGSMNFDCAKGKYRHPALLTKELLPDNLSIEEEIVP